MRKHCIEIGGGGWMMGENPSPLDQYILSLSGKENPNICFLPSITCYGIHDYAALHFVDGKLLATVTSFPDAGVLVKTGNEENILRG
ncbi:hypothetical protein HJ178_07075 [Vibrio parahaemolyticus]|nr:hypothetical protein [Vibrio parahaemolyticus]MBE3827668.1 hypothetical protein [Vibrio parahaemolyticus]MBE3981709.1 hypothetical protein [Vibrio parahaemolyticus]HCG7193749.1 hypothetical protein [Vibrio parahaemolyticus]HCG7195520.1 hypothetical protein [Vibrio parahaemolyticus]